ncbi:aldehyde dehydrogenase [Halovulum dunhuangense]|uniref:Aldehyde dehydrogenase n=2 Tax=Halovulum dunhuangense TaxID=1505036 RepID=A0A849L6J9_9RHOB|nr:aldehyde dehydrogenase [Halovulum dunhuangense]NNU82026.1 aldehyde dehydrogenase [Halovulum dunhuangense]
MLIGGEWTDGTGGERLDSYNPFTQEVWGTIPQATEQDVGNAIEIAHRTFRERWRHVNGRDRAAMLNRLADLIEENAEELATIDSTDNGKVIRETRSQMRFAARNYRYFAGYADKLQGNTIPLDNGQMFDYTLVEPLGVAVLITAWNSPLPLLANKLAPALAAGNTVVIKPSEHASLSTLAFGKLIAKAGFPDGVVNIVTGDGRIGNALTANPLVRKISFTGGLPTARRILESAAAHLIPVTTELGGKSPNIIFADADLNAAVTGAVAGVFGASGQTCIAGSRLLVQRAIYDEVCRLVVEKVRGIKLGNPLDETTEMGPVANRAQLDKILAMIQQARDEGANIAVGGAKASGPALEGGYFVEPTVIVDVDPSLTIAREEVFGPVLCIIPFEDEADAVAIANATEYGLASGVWTNDLRRAHRVAREIEAGLVWLNTYRASYVGAPFGGTKLSGHGRERSWHALLEYTQVKNVMLDLSAEERDPFAMKL